MKTIIYSKQLTFRFASLSLLVLCLAYSVDSPAAYEFVSSFGTSGSSGGQFLTPRGVAISQQGKIVVTESGNHRVQVCTEQGVCTNFGNFGTLSGEFDRPRGVAINSVDRLFIADRGNDRIESCAITGSCTDFGGSGTVVGKFESPRGVAIDAQDMIYITDTDYNRVQVCDAQGNCTAFGSFGSALGQFDSPSGIAIDQQSKVVIADRGNSRIQICSSQGTNCTAFGSSGTAAGQFDQPASVAVDSKDRIIVADRFNDRVQVCSHQGVCADFGSFGSAEGQFNLPWGVAVDDQDRIIVADSGNDRIQIFAETTTPPVVEIVAFTASPSSILEAETTTLSWSVSNATQCTAMAGTSDWQAITPSAGGGAVDITIATEGSYIFTLQCTDGSNTVSANANVTVTTKPTVPPTQPGVLSASAVSANSVTISWGASTDGDGDTITYRVEYRRNGELLWTSGGNTTDTSQPLSGLDADQSYDVRVTPNDGTVDGINRTVLNLFKTDFVNSAPTQPGVLSVPAVSANSATISWGASTDDDGDTITYRVEYRHNGESMWTSGSNTTDTSQLLSGLDADQSYDVRVTPNDGTVDGINRTALNLFKTDFVNSAPTQPGVLSASAVTTNSVTVSWIASTDIDGDIITYRVAYRQNGSTQWFSAGSTTGTIQPLTGLDADQSYDVMVTPNDGTVDGTNRMTPNLFKTDVANTAPTQPGTLSAFAVAISVATVSWLASTDIDSDTITYRVEYRRNGDTLWRGGGSTTGVSQPLSGLDADQSYDVRVTPNDGTDDGASRTALNLFRTDIDPDAVYKDGFEGN